MFSRKLVFIIIGWIAVLILGLIVLLSACAQPPSNTSTAVVSESATPELSIAPNPPTQEIVTIDLTGEWTAKINQTIFNVHVANSVVTITMVNNGKSALYWYGTIADTGTVGEIVTSTKLEVNKAVLSSAKSKTFTVGKKTLTFEVSAMGKTRNVEVAHV